MRGWSPVINGLEGTQRGAARCFSHRTQITVSLTKLAQTPERKRVAELQIPFTLAATLLPARSTPVPRPPLLPPPARSYNPTIDSCPRLRFEIDSEYMYSSVLELVVCRVRFARVSCPRLRFVTVGKSYLRLQYRNSQYTSPNCFLPPLPAASQARKPMPKCRRATTTCSDHKTHALHW